MILEAAREGGEAVAGWSGGEGEVRAFRESRRAETKAASENRRWDEEAEGKIIQSVAGVWRTPRFVGELKMSPQMEALNKSANE